MRERIMPDDAKTKLLFLLGQILEQQRAVSECLAYYRNLEKEIETKQEKSIYPEDRESFSKEIEVLNKEYESKSDLLFEELNQSLLEADRLSKKIGGEIEHEFKALFEYMTTPREKETKFDLVEKDISRIKKLFS